MQIGLGDLEWLGDGLARPECVLCTASGETFLSRRDGLTRIGADGRSAHRRIGTPGRWTTNGFAIDEDGSFLLANIGDDGGVWRWSPTRGLEPFLLEIGAVQVPPVNFVGIDDRRRAWVSISTHLRFRDLAFRRDVCDGFIVLVDAKGARIVAEDLGFTNECHVDPSGKWLYVNETYVRRLSRFALREDGSLGRRETVTEFADGAFPDGLAIDVEGAIWVACVVANRLVRVTPDGRQHVVLDDGDPALNAEIERAYAADGFARAHLDRGARRTMGNLASLAFGGSDLKTVHMGSLGQTRMARFRSPVAGVKPHHWTIRPEF